MRINIMPSPQIHHTRVLLLIQGILCSILGCIYKHIYSAFFQQIYLKGQAEPLSDEYKCRSSKRECILVHIIVFLLNLGCAFLKFNYLFDAAFRYGRGYGLCWLIISSLLVVIMMRKFLCTP